jgi:hypothetical protein
MGIVAFEGEEDPEIAVIREALGALPIGPPATYWLQSDARGEWVVRRQGDSDERRFASRDEALTFLRLAVVRCAYYCLYLQHGDDSLVRRSHRPHLFLRGRSSI